MRILSTTLLVLITLLINAQEIKVSGSIVDKNSLSPLVGATIRCDDFGTITNEVGEFELVVSENCELTISYIGYESITISDLSSNMKIRLTPESTILDEMIVTGSKYQKRLSETTVSVDVLKPDLIRSVNAKSTGDILNKVPGVQIIGGQANIRGGSGFSYGAGSRVMILIDGMPALQADSGFANWGDIPIEALDQVEILKGAASSLYGSAAMNGIIHFRRKTAKAKPSLNVFTSYTRYMDPAIEISKWWEDDDHRYIANVGMSYAQKLGKIDLSTHGFYSNEESFRAETFTEKARGGLNLKYHLNDRIKIGVNTLLNYNKGQDYFVWDNDLRGLLKPFPGTIASGSRTRAIIDPYVQFYQNENSIHRLQFRYFFINNKNEFNRSNSSGNTFGEYQYQRTFDELDLIWTSGATGSTTSTKAELFGDTSFNYNNLGIYTQGEKKWNNWSFSGGIRYEYNEQKSPTFFEGVSIPNGKLSEGALVCRLGLTYALQKGTTLRASWGQGYRFPTISERFIRTSFGGFEVFPNPLLQSENGYTFETGIKQAIKFGGFTAFGDLAFFSSTYYNMIEFSFLSDPLGFKPINVGNTRINGGEISLNGQFNLGEINFNVLTGYTFIDPKYLNFDEREEIRNNISTDRNVLKYRSQHAFKIDLRCNWKWLRSGVSLQANSHQVNIDRRLETPFDGVDLFKIRAFRETNNNGYQLLEFRFGAEYQGIGLNVIMSNALNQNYAIRPGLLEAPRNLTVRIDYNLN